jgi:hypothetical protein
MRNNYVIPAESVRDRCKTAAISLRNHCAIALKRLTIALQSLQNRCGIIARSLRKGYKFAAQSMRNRFTIALLLPRNHCKITAESLRS